MKIMCVLLKYNLFNIKIRYLYKFEIRDLIKINVSNYESIK